jgi:hypothetical protein
MGLIDLPSGAKVEIRGMTGREAKVMTDKDAYKNGTFLGKLLNGCTQAVVDPGPYSTASFGWADALVGDRFYAFMQLRIATFGKDFVFKIQCQEQSCRERFEYQIDLEKDLPVKRLSDADRACFASGNEFVTKDKSGRAVHFKLPTGQDEVIAARAASFDSAFIMSMERRITGIDGVPIVRKYLEESPFGDLLALLDAFDEHNCGVDTDIEIQCPHCGSIQDIRVPFAQGFLVPTRSKKPSSP